MSYAAKAGDEHLVQEAIDVGAQVAQALATDAAPSALVAAGVLPEHLRSAARLAVQAAANNRPAVWPSMAPDAALHALEAHGRHQGRGIAAVLAQLARDIEAGRTVSIGVEMDANHHATTAGGRKVRLPIIRRHGLAPSIGAARGVALLLLDADADIAVNRRLFGDDLRPFTVPAVRQAYVIQVSDAAVAKSSLAPPDRLPNNAAKAATLRQRVAGLVDTETADGKRVLVVAPLQVRRALTGEDGKLDTYANWCGAELTHFGRHLGVNRWSAFGTVVVVGREELPPVTAERMARAVWCDANVALNLTGKFTTALRCHDMRNGQAQAVSVRVHADARVQALVEMSRERAVAQAIDRLRLIHRDPSKPARVIVLSNLPIPGLVVDRLLPLDDALSGGTVWECAMARMPGGVLPLAVNYLAVYMIDLFGSLRSIERNLPDIKPPLGNIDSLLPFGGLFGEVRFAKYWVAGHKRPSAVLIRNGVSNPRGELERVLGVPVVQFEDPGAVPDVATSVAATDVAPALSRASTAKPGITLNRNGADGLFEKVSAGAHTLAPANLHPPAPA